MPYPPYPSRVSNFQQAENAGADISASDLDADLNNLVECLTQTQDVVRGITTASGQLKNQSRATAQALSGSQRFVATASQTQFNTTIAWSAAFTNRNVEVTSQGVDIDPNSVTVANNAGNLRVTIPAQTLNNVVVVKAFESGAGLTTNLASTSAGQGASLIGVQDAGALYAATNAEAALAEVMTKLNTLTTNIGTIADIIRRTGTVAFTANQSMGGFRLTNLANAVSGTDAPTLTQVNSLIAAIGSPTSAILRDGTQAPTANVGWGGFKITNLGTPTATTDAATKAYVDALAFPVGVVMQTATAAAPSGWLLCDGSAVSRTTYAALFAAIGTTYGAGDGTTTFNVPDARGRAPIGAGTGTGLSARALGAQVGAETHVLSIAEMPAHTHTFNENVGTADNLGGTTALSRFTNPRVSTTNSTGSGSAHNNMQPSLVFNFIIKT